MSSIVTADAPAIQSLSAYGPARSTVAGQPLTERNCAEQTRGGAPVIISAWG
jgi:hypothetical protein